MTFGDGVFGSLSVPVLSDKKLLSFRVIGNGNNPFCGVGVAVGVLGGDVRSKDFFESHVASVAVLAAFPLPFEVVWVTAPFVVESLFFACVLFCCCGSVELCSSFSFGDIEMNPFV